MLYANATLFYNRDLSIHGYGSLWGILEPIPMDTEGQFASLFCSSVYEKEKKKGRGRKEVHLNNYKDHIFSQLSTCQLVLKLFHSFMW